MRIITLLITMLLPMLMISQTSVWQRVNSNLESQTKTKLSEGLAAEGITSPVFAYLGWSSVYEFGDSDIDQVLVSGNVLYELTTAGSVHIPVMTNIQLDFGSPINEFEVGIYPYTVKNNLVIHGAAEFAADGALENKRFTLFTGLEYAIPTATGLPVTMGAGPVVDIWKETTVWGVDAVLVIPLANGLGLLGGIEKRFNGSPLLIQLGIAASTPL